MIMTSLHILHLSHGHDQPSYLASDLVGLEMDLQDVGGYTTRALWMDSACICGASQVHESLVPMRQKSVWLCAGIFSGLYCRALQSSIPSWMRGSPVTVYFSLRFLSHWISSGHVLKLSLRGSLHVVAFGTAVHWSRVSVLYYSGLWCLDFCWVCWRYCNQKRDETGVSKHIPEIHKICALTLALLRSEEKIVWRIVCAWEKNRSNGLFERVVFNTCLGWTTNIVKNVLYWFW